MATQDIETAAADLRRARMLATRSAAVCFGLIIGSIDLPSISAEDPISQPDRPKFVICASERDAEFGESLFRVLRRPGERARFGRAETIEQALESEAEVIVLVLPGRDLPPLEERTLAALKHRKIVGIGLGAARLFGQLGLEINNGACAHGAKAPAELTITKSELLGEPKDAKPLLVLNEPEADGNADKIDLFAMFVPSRSPNAAVVDVIARWTSDPNYAPIVRQGNCVLIGIPAPATRWTANYAGLVRELCLALKEGRLEQFSTARRTLTKPGDYEFQLAKRGSTDVEFETTRYLRFSEPTRLTVQLEHAGSDAVMLLFRGEDAAFTHRERKDARQGETLTITADITADDIQKLGDRYWVLNVTNFGAAPADCKLTIRCVALTAAE